MKEIVGRSLGLDTHEEPMTKTGEALPDGFLCSRQTSTRTRIPRSARCASTTPCTGTQRHRAWLVTRFDDGSAGLSNFKDLSSASASSRCST